MSADLKLRSVCLYVWKSSVERVFFHRRSAILEDRLSFFCRIGVPGLPIDLARSAVCKRGDSVES